MHTLEFWERYMRGYDALALLDDYTAYLDELAERLAIRPGQVLLDAGCGTGNLAIRLTARGARLVGLDFSAAALAQHRAKCPECSLVRGSLEDPLPFADASFDHATCLSVLFALSPPGARLALREFRRVLKPGGSLVVTAKRPARSRLSLVWRHLRVRWRKRGAGRLLGELRSTAGPLLRILAYNCMMRRLSASDGYRSIGAEELLEEVRSAGFEAPNYQTTYEGFFHLVTARRPAGAAAAGAPAAVPVPAACS